MCGGRNFYSWQKRDEITDVGLCMCRKAIAVIGLGASMMQYREMSCYISYQVWWLSESDTDKKQREVLISVNEINAMSPGFTEIS